MGGNGDNRNLILAAVLSMAVVFAWQAFISPPPKAPQQVTATQGETGAQIGAHTGATTEAVPAAVPAGESPAVAPEQTAETRADALAQSPRIRIETPSLSGSVDLTGGRLDDLHLSQYRDTLAPDSPTVVLLNPANGPEPYYVDYGWRRTVGSDPGPLPNGTTPWTVESGDKLTPKTPAVLRWDNGKGLTFRRTFEVDDHYMFTVTQSVENSTGAAVTLAPYGLIAHRGEPKHSPYAGRLVHEGAVGMFDGKLSEVKYSAMRDLAANSAERGPFEDTAVAKDGWLGFTAKYWMSIMAPQPGTAFDAVYRVLNVNGIDEYRTEMRLPVVSIAPGANVREVTNLFAGAKEVATIRSYQETRGIDRFEDAVDWGWFYFLTKPIFRLLDFYHALIGNMGFSIIVLTLTVKACLFPLAYKSFVSMSKMKKLQPEMEKIKERVGDDKQKMQQEMMALYKKEKVNPAAGCLPIVLQIPIFFSLYKVLYVTIEMRHAPFILWIHDLSAPDPTSVLNLFGLVPWDIPPFLHLFSIGVFPILMGITMWLQQQLNPKPTDSTQAMIFTWMPWVFMFMLGGFASGLVIYWCANNILTFSQQYIIMRSQGLNVDILGNIRSGFKGKAPAKAAAKPHAPAKAEPEAAIEEDDAGEAGSGSRPGGRKPAQGPRRRRGRKG